MGTTNIMFAFNVASLIELFASWEVHPTAVTGYSSGEIASAYATGMINLKDAMAVAYYRRVGAEHVVSAVKEGKGKHDGRGAVVGPGSGSSIFPSF